MTITDEAKATEALHRIGYYRLSGYWHPMREIALPRAAGPPTFLDKFKDDSHCSAVVDLYVFDKKLRLLVLDAVERIEVGLRVEMALLVSARDPLAHRREIEVHHDFVAGRNGTKHSEWLARHDETVDKSKEEFILHFRRTYSTPLPMWMAIELWDFGTLSMFLSGMKAADLNVLAKYFGLPRRDLLTTWVRTINHVRNICAHHNRLWNRVLVDSPSPPKIRELANLDHLAATLHAQNRLYAAAVALRWFLLKLNPTSTWADRLKQHFTTFPESPHYHVSQTGFPADWEKLPYLLELVRYLYCLGPYHIEALHQERSREPAASYFVVEVLVILAVAEHCGQVGVTYRAAPQLGLEHVFRDFGVIGFRLFLLGGHAGAPNTINNGGIYP